MEIVETKPDAKLRKTDLRRTALFARRYQNGRSLTQENSESADEILFDVAQDIQQGGTEGIGPPSR